MTQQQLTYRANIVQNVSKKRKNGYKVIKKVGSYWEFLSTIAVLYIMNFLRQANPSIKSISWVLWKWSEVGLF